MERRDIPTENSVDRLFNSNEWRNLDQAADPTAFVRWIQTRNARPGNKALRDLRFALLQPQVGDRLLDVGCGPGEDVLALAQIVGTTGMVVGVDISEAMIATARQQAAGLDLPVEFRVGSVYHLEFPDNSFDGCEAARTFIHLEDPRRALAEMVRVLRPGGRIVLNDPDGETSIVDVPGDQTVTRKIANARTDRWRNGWMGRQLFGLLREAGLTDISVKPVANVSDNRIDGFALDNWRQAARDAQAAGVVSAAEAASWVASLEAAFDAGRFFTSMTTFVVGGRKP